MGVTIPNYFVFIHNILIVLQVSVSCGIPDFRSRDGVYAKLSVEYPDLPDPQAMFDISYFYKNPRPFFKFAKVSIHYTSLYSIFYGSLSEQARWIRSHTVIGYVHSKR